MDKNRIETGMLQMLQLSGGYQEKNIHPKNEKRRRWIRRVILCALLLFFGILGVRRGSSAYLAMKAEGELQTASSYKKIYQSFERVESNQLRLRRKWENHRGINMSFLMEGANLSSLMLSRAGGAVSTVFGAVKDVTGVGEIGIGQYRQDMMAASEESGSSVSEADGDRENTPYQYIPEEYQQYFMAEPSQWIAQGDYIYTLWMKDVSKGWVNPEPKLVVYHAVDGQMEQVYESASMIGGYETEMTISGNHLYLAMNDDSYDEYYNEEYGEMDICERPEGCLLYVYDISNPANPQRIETLTQYGSYYSMKIAGKYLYMFSKFQDFTAQSHKDTDSYIPKVGEEKIPPEDIYMQRDLYGTGYVVISAYRLSNYNNKAILTDTKAVAGTGDCIQWNSNTIYICSQVVPKRSDCTDRTGVTVLSYEDGKISGKDHLIVKGSIDMTQEVDVNEARLHLPMQVNTYQSSFIKIDGSIIPGWESASMKIQMQEDSFCTEKQNICIDGVGEKVHETSVILPEEKIRNTGFEGQLFEVDDKGNYIGVGHTRKDKNLKLLWYAVSSKNSPVVRASVSLREYYSPVTDDGRLIYFDRSRSLIGFCAKGSRGTYYYLYRYQQDTIYDPIELQELCQENFENKWQASWIRGVMLHPEEGILYMVRSSNIRMQGLAKPIFIEQETK